MFRVFKNFDIKILKHVFDISDIMQSITCILKKIFFFSLKYLEYELGCSCHLKNH